MTPEVLGVFGPSRQQVRVVRRDQRIIVEWYEHRLRREKSWPDARGNVAIARTWAKAFATERVLPRKPEIPRLTVRELWDLYHSANWSSLAPNTQRLYSDDWKKWELYAGKHLVAEDVTPAMLHGFRRALEQRGLGINSIRQAVKTAKIVYNWAEREELIGRNRWRLYQLKIAKKDQPTSPPEFNQAETTALLATLDPDDGRQWRAWVALTILEAQGMRQVSALQLRWADVHLRGRIIRWPKETDKNGRELVQPLRKATVRALRVARDHARTQEITSPYILYSGKRGREGKPYTSQSLWAALQTAERKAGVEHKRGRAGHGYRKKLVGDISDITGGDTILALRMVGDRDPRRAEEYRKDRDEQAVDAFRRLDRKKVK